MAESLDVAARLAEGRPAVDNIGDYVWACHLLGYQNPDLTLHAAQVRDWYSSEDGLDLRVLEADRAALDAAAAATESARQLQEQQLGALAGAWQGRGGDASHEFLLRHGEASAAAATALRDAVDALTALRDDLWHSVDEKVAAAVAIDDRSRAERHEWLAATQTVTTGAGDRAVASELVDQQVKPFVDNDIRSDWVTAMQTAMAAVAAAFDAATATLTADTGALFGVPGDLGPASTPLPSTASPGQVTSTAPAAWPIPATAAAPVVNPMTAPPPAFPAVAGTRRGAIACSSSACGRTRRVGNADDAPDALTRRSGWRVARRRRRTRRSGFSARRRDRRPAEPARGCGPGSTGAETSLRRSLEDGEPTTTDDEDAEDETAQRR